MPTGSRSTRRWSAMLNLIETVRECSKRWLGGARGRYGRLATHRFHLIEAGRYTSALSPDST